MGWRPVVCELVPLTVRNGGTFAVCVPPYFGNVNGFSEFANKRFMAWKRQKVEDLQIKIVVA